VKETIIAPTPAPPYYAVIFTSVRTANDDGYAKTAEEMLRLAALQPGYLGVESVREGGQGITVSYWRDLESIRRWKAVADHAVAQRLGRERWYSAYKTRISLVEDDYGFALKASDRTSEAEPR
jgi:heme-degrading monooxygenase HmoA